MEIADSSSSIGLDANSGIEPLRTAPTPFFDTCSEAVSASGFHGRSHSMSTSLWGAYNSSNSNNNNNNRHNNSINSISSSSRNSDAFQSRTQQHYQHHQLIGLNSSSEGMSDSRIQSNSNNINSISYNYATKLSTMGSYGSSGYGQNLCQIISSTRQSIDAGFPSTTSSYSAASSSQATSFVLPKPTPLSSNSRVPPPGDIRRSVPTAGQRRERIMKESLTKLRKDRSKYLDQLRTIRNSSSRGSNSIEGISGASGGEMSSYSTGSSIGYPYMEMANSIMQSVVRDLDTEGSYLFRDDDLPGGEEEESDVNTDEYQDMLIRISQELEKELKYDVDDEEGSFEAQHLAELNEIEDYIQNGISCSVQDDPNYLVCPFCRTNTMEHVYEDMQIISCSDCLVELNYGAWRSIAQLRSALGDVFDSHHRYCVSASSDVSSFRSSSSNSIFGGGGGGGGGSSRSCLESSLENWSSLSSNASAKSRSKSESTRDRLTIFSQNTFDLYAMCSFCGFSEKIVT